MKILQVMPDFVQGGAETMCEHLTYELLKHGHQVTVVSLFSYPCAITGRFEAAGVDLRFLGKKKGLDLSTVRKLRKIIKEMQPDVIHCHCHSTPYAMTAAILSGQQKRVLTVHNVAQKESGRFGRLLNRCFIKHHHVTPVALSGIVQETIMDVYGLPKERIPVVYNGIDLSNCLPKENYAVEGNFKIIHIGRFSEQKNHLGLIAAFKIFHDKHPDSELWLLGDGEERPSIEEAIKTNDLADNVKLLGIQSNVYGYLHDADMFTLPSNYEGIPMTIIEAMGTGLPIAATSVGGIPDMLENGKEAILVDNDPIKIADAFERYYLSEELRRSYGQNAKKRSIQFSAEAMAKGYLEIYKK